MSAPRHAAARVIGTPRARVGAALLLALAACCPAPAAGPSVAGAPAAGADGTVRVAVRTADGVAAEGGGRLGHLPEGGVVWLEPAAGLTLPAGASFVAIGAPTGDGAIRVREVAPAGAAP